MVGASVRGYALKMADPKSDLLRSIPLFARLGSRELQRLSQLTTMLMFPQDAC